MNEGSDRRGHGWVSLVGQGWGSLVQDVCQMLGFAGVFGGGRAFLRRGEGVTWDPGVPGQGTQVHHCAALLSQQVSYPLLIN